jgi:hypothetical protein
MISPKDKTIIRDLAKRVVEIADLPVMDERRDMWTRHNRLERVRPMILIFPEGCWIEILPHDRLECEDDEARRFEWALRSRIVQHEDLRDDTVIEKNWVVTKIIRNSGWGLEAQHKPSGQFKGAWAFDPVIKEPADLEKLRVPTVEYDEPATMKNLEQARDLFGDILDVRLKGVSHLSFHLMNQYTGLRGLEQVMMDMVLEPQWVHDAMAFLEEGHRSIVRQYRDQNLLDLNNDGTYHSSGGVGYTDELPQPDYDGEHVRPVDMWSSAEAQEMAQVSPDMHREFILEYEKRLLEPFGLNGYGCCEDLTNKMEDVLTIPNIRRISISPFADVEKCAAKLNGKAIFSWKPHPSHLVGTFNADMIRDSIRHTLEATKDCVVEMILKDTHTCENHPERFTQWSGIARELANEYAS